MPKLPLNLKRHRGSSEENTKRAVAGSTPNLVRSSAISTIPSCIHRSVSSSVHAGFVWPAQPTASPPTCLPASLWTISVISGATGRPKLTCMKRHHPSFHLPNMLATAVDCSLLPLTRASSSDCSANRSSVATLLRCATAALS